MTSVRRRVAALTAATAALLAVGASGRAATQVGFKAHSYAGFNAEASAGAITGQKPESKLWYHDGAWWAVMLSPAASGAHRIWRLDPAGWVDTGVTIDPRPATKEDVLLVGNTLYVTSRSAGSVNLLRRFTYSGGTYALDAGFPVQFPDVSGPETLTLARDSTGTLWITFEKNQNIYVARSQNGDDRVWGSPFVIPVTGATGVSDDDISAIISFTDATGPAIGVWWSNQNAHADYFAVHRDGAPDASWIRETAVSGTGWAEDHVNLKTFEGRIYAAIKTNKETGGATLIALVVRQPDGTWQTHHVASTGEGNTRPIAVLDIDPAKRLLYVFMTLGEGTSARGIYYKTASLDGISFPTTATPFIRGPLDEPINDATSTKQNTTAQSGIVVLASDGANYWWNRLGGGTATAPPTADAGSAATDEDVPVTITLTGSDPDTCELLFSVATAPAHGSLGAIADQACAPGSPNRDRATVVYTPSRDYSGPDTFTFRVNDGATSSAAATISITVNPVNDAPTATGGARTTTTDTPVTVTLNASDPETCELAFAIAQPPAHGSLSGLSNGACTPGAPNTDRASVTYTPASGFTGSDSFAFTASDGALTSAPATVSITVGPAATGITFRASSSAANATATSLTIPVPSGLAVGDVMLASVAVRGKVKVTMPAGWAQVRVEQSNEILRQHIYVRVAGAEPLSYTWRFSSPQPAAGGIVAYAGVDTTAPIDAHSGRMNMVDTTIITAPSLTTTVPGAMLVGFFAITSNTTITPPAGMAERFDLASNAGAFFVTVEGSDSLLGAAGATGDRSATAGIAGWNIGQLVALRPAGSGGGPTPSPSPSPTCLKNCTTSPPPPCSKNC